LDDDCDGSTDEDYASESTSCGVGACAASGSTSCEAGVVANSCTAGPAEADDLTCDGVDDDCNGQVDDGFAGEETRCGVGACESAGLEACVDGSVRTGCEPRAPESNSDDTCDGIDDDCDGVADEDFTGQATSCGVGECAAAGSETCVGGVLGDDCAPTTPAADDASCDGLDDDCDGEADEDFTGQATSCGVGECAAAGLQTCIAGELGDNCAPTTPAADDASCDGLDNDCDGVADEDYAPRSTNCGVGACAAEGLTSCAGGSEQDSCSSGTPASEDATCNGIDDDCDGDIDEDCVLSTTTTTTTTTTSTTTTTLPACSDTLGFDRCKLKPRFRKTASGTDKLTVSCKVLDASAVVGGINPGTEDSLFTLDDTAGECFTSLIDSSICIQKPSGFKCKSPKGDTPAVQMKLKSDRRNPGNYKFKYKAKSTDLQCLSTTASPWTMGLEIGDDCGQVDCPATGSRIECPGE